MWMLGMWIKSGSSETLDPELEEGVECGGGRGEGYEEEEYEKEGGREC